MIKIDIPSIEWLREQRNKPKDPSVIVAPVPNYAEHGHQATVSIPALEVAQLWAALPEEQQQVIMALLESMQPK